MAVGPALDVHLPRDTGGMAVHRNEARREGVLKPAAVTPVKPAITARAVRLKGKALVKLLDAATGATLRTLKPFRNFGGKVRVELIDVDGDGNLDLVATARINGKVRKKVFSGVALA